MQTAINNIQDLDAAIYEMEARQVSEKEILEEQFKITREGLKPANIVKGLVDDIANSTTLKDMVVDNVIGFATGLVSKKLVFGNTSNPLKKIIGTALQFGVGNLVAKNAEVVKETVGKVLKKWFFKKKNDTKELEEEVIL